jgi:hypothetical protein
MTRRFATKTMTCWRTASSSGSARLGRSQKDGLPSRSRYVSTSSRPSTRATGRGAAWSLPPFNREQRWTPKQETAFSCSRPYRCSAQPPPGLRITLFSPQSLLRSAPSPLSAPQAQGTGADMDKDYLTLKRVPTHASVEDYDVAVRRRSSRPHLSFTSGEVDVGVQRS